MIRLIYAGRAGAVAAGGWPCGAAGTTTRARTAIGAQAGVARRTNRWNIRPPKPETAASYHPQLRQFPGRQRPEARVHDLQAFSEIMRHRRQLLGAGEQVMSAAGAA